MQLVLGCTLKLTATLPWLLAAAEKPVWEGPLCHWHAPSQECYSFIFSPGSIALPKSRCGKTSITTEAACTAEKDTAGMSCYWNADREVCEENLCSSFTETKCLQSTSAPQNCSWDGFECVAPTCSNSKYLTREACEADANGAGSCYWVASGSTGSCQTLSCGTFNESSCVEASSKVPPMKFMFGSAPYGKTPCFWSSSGFCIQISQCQNYMNMEECTADSAGFGRCAWSSSANGGAGMCADMQRCSDYTDEASCLSDSYSSAARVHQAAKCWWQAGSPGKCDVNLPSISEYVGKPECETLSENSCSGAGSPSPSSSQASSISEAMARKTVAVVSILLLCLTAP